jgi:hypothetical protein
MILPLKNSKTIFLSFKKIEKIICMFPTIYPTNLHKIMFKYIVFWATQKQQMYRYEYVYLQNYKLIRFCYLCSPQYKEYRNKI